VKLRFLVKWTQYLLVAKVRNDKSKYLAQAGFTQENPEVLLEAVPNNTPTAAPLESPPISATSPVCSGAGPADSSEKQKPADAAEQQRNYTCPELMKRVFAADVVACMHCGGRLRILTTIRPPEITRKILDHLGLPSRPPPVYPATSQGLPFAFE